MTPETREKIRMQLLSLGAEVVIGTARGSGDSADEFGIRAARYIMPGDNVRTERHVRKRTYPGSSFVSEIEMVKIWVDGELVMDKEHYSLKVETGTDAPFEGILDEFDKALASVAVDTPPTLQEDLNTLFEGVVDDNLWWDFNDDGSYGELAWNLKTNKARVEGGYWVTESHPEEDGDPLGIEDEETEEEQANV